MSIESLIKEIIMADKEVSGIITDEIDRRRKILQKAPLGNDATDKAGAEKNMSLHRDQPELSKSSATLAPTKPPVSGYMIDSLGRYRPDFRKTTTKQKNPKAEKPVNVGSLSEEVKYIEANGKRIKRDATFRARVIAAYGSACVMCGYAAHVEAAHLNPKHKVSDDRTENGAPLCPNHHWELDHGLLTPDEVIARRDKA